MACNCECLTEALQAFLDCAKGHKKELEGCITLTQGHHQITIATPHLQPKDVWLTVIPIEIPVCNGNVNMVGFTLLDNGFVLYADIASNSAEVCYIAEG